MSLYILIIVKQINNLVSLSKFKGKFKGSDTHVYRQKRREKLT